MTRVRGDRDDVFLGLDAGTQSLKAVLINADLKRIAQAAIDFDEELPEFKTVGGVHVHGDGKTVTSPAVMWVAALDGLLAKMQSDRWPLEHVAAVSGSGQQHGSVWLNRMAARALRELNPSLWLRPQLSDCFSIDDSPVWMDSSTGVQCAQREAAMGGAQAVADVTGSRAYERFTGNQIARIYQLHPDRYQATERIALVSSFMASLLTGRTVDIDVSDASGMNLMNLRSRQWSGAALECTAPGLKEKLGDPVPSHTVLGNLHSYYPARYGFRSDCRVIAFSGDNPNSLAGLKLMKEGDTAVSLGTSDTLFGSLATPRPSGREGHVFAHPVDPRGYMALLCWKNGSLAREAIRDDVANGSWPAFDALLQASPPGNQGRIGFYFKEPEITPPVMNPVIARFDAFDRPVDAFTPEEEVRSVVEGRFLAMRLHAAGIGITPRRVLATGGASGNDRILRVMADVFGVPVDVGECPGSAALGAAYRAVHGVACERANVFVPFEQVVAKAPGPVRSLAPDHGAFAVYSECLTRYARLEQRVRGEV